MCVTVRHTPLTLMDSPSSRPSNGAAIVSFPPTPPPWKERTVPSASTRPVNTSFLRRCGARAAAREELVDEPLRVARELREDHAHPRRILVHADDLADAFDRLDVVHDHGEVQVHLRADRERRLRANEDPRPRDVRDVLV